MRKTWKTISVVVTMAIVFGILPVTALADGYYYVDTSYIVLHPGETATIAVGADNAAGRVDWGSEGAVTSAGSTWLDNNVDTISITADDVGTGYVYVTPTNIAAYDDDTLFDYGYTIEVQVVSDEPEAVQEPAPQIADEITYDELNDTDTAQEQPLQQIEEETPQEEPATEGNETETQAVTGDILTDGNTDYEGLSEEERLYTNVNGQDLYIIRFPRWRDEEGNIVWNDEVFNLDVLPGFELSTVNYKGMNVDTFQYKDEITAFVIKDPATDRSNYYVLKSDGTGFEELAYLTANGKTYIVVDFPSDFVVPEGYQMVEMTLGSCKVHALKQIVDTQEAAEEETETVTEPVEEIPYDDAAAGGIWAPAIGRSAQIVVDSRIEVMLKGYETKVDPGLESTDPSADLYYIYCLVDGKTQLYSYDSVEGTLQRASITIYHEIPTEPETVIIYQEAPTQEPQTTPEAQQPTVAGTETDNAGSFLQKLGWNDMQIQVKVLMIALAVAILLIIILIILFATMSRRNKKRNKKNRRSNVPPRSNRRTTPLNEDDDAFFSYVKTDEDYDSDNRK